MWEDNRRWTFSLEKELLWIIEILARSESLKLKNTWFLYYKNAALTDDMQSCVDLLWIIIITFVLAIRTLFLTAPIHCSPSIGEQVIEWYIYSI